MGRVQRPRANTTDTERIPCVTTGGKYDNDWEGVPFRALYDAIGVSREAKASMSTATAVHDDVPLEDC